MTTETKVKTIPPELRLAKRLISIARQDHAEWMAAYRRETFRGEDERAEACLVGANTVEQIIKRMEKELRALAA